MIARPDETRQPPSSQAPAKAPGARPPADAAGGHAAPRRPKKRSSRAAVRAAAAGAAPLIGFAFRLWMSTVRIRWVDYGPIRELEERGEQIIFAVPHGRMLPFVYTHRQRLAPTLISEHGDGEIIARIAAELGYVPVRGSSTRGGARAFLKLVRQFKDAQDTILVPDGPRGPAFHVDPGLVVLANRIGAWICVASFAADRQWTAPSWDAARIPLPGSRMTACIDAPVRIEGRLDAAAVTAYAADLERRLRRTDERATALAQVDRPDGLSTGPWPGRRSAWRRGDPSARP